MNSMPSICPVTAGGHLASFHFTTITNHAAFIIGFVPRTRTGSGINCCLHVWLLLFCFRGCCQRVFPGSDCFTLPPASSCCSASSAIFGTTRLSFCWSGGSVALIFISLVIVRLSPPHVFTRHWDFSRKVSGFFCPFLLEFVLITSLTNNVL